MTRIGEAAEAAVSWHDTKITGIAPSKHYLHNDTHLSLSPPFLESSFQDEYRNSISVEIGRVLAPIIASSSPSPLVLTRSSHETRRVERRRSTFGQTFYGGFASRKMFIEDERWKSVEKGKDPAFEGGMRNPNSMHHRSWYSVREFKLRIVGNRYEEVTPPTGRK